MANVNAIQGGHFTEGMVPTTDEALNVLPWAGSANLYDPAKVGEIARDSVTGRRRYQIHRTRTRTTNTAESHWLKNADDLETWLMVKGLCKDAKWNLSVKIPSSATLSPVEYSRIGGKRKYHYSDGSLIKTSDWLQNGGELDTWLLAVGACILTGAPGEDPEDCTTHDHETTPTAKAVVAAPEPHDPYALGFEIVNTNPEHEEVLYSEWGPEALDLVVVPPSCPYPLFPVNARSLHTYLQIGKDFSTWMKDRIAGFKLIKDQDYSIDSPDLGNQTGRGGDRRSKEYWLTSDATQWLAADGKSERGVQVIKYLVARNKRLAE